MEFEGRKKVRTHLDIAPLIDVVFLLLIFFMLSSHFVSQSGIKITLPAAVTSKLRPEENVVIYISENNSLCLNKEEVILKNLVDRLRLKIKETGKKTVTIKADKKIDLDLAVKVMDRAKQAGAEGIVISTKIEHH